MKRCPKCKRTYASDEFTFCLDDGALLSAPYSPQSDESADKIPSPPPTKVLRAAPPQTEVLPAALKATVPSPSPQERSRTAEIPTLTVPNPAAIPAAQPASPGFMSPQGSSRNRKTRLRMLFMASPLLLVGLVFGVIFIYASRCPTLSVYCSPGENSAGCVVDGPPFWANGIVSQSVSWDWSAGGLGFRRMSDDGAVFDTTGFAGKEFTVTATYRNWWCTTRASKTFLAK